MPLQETLFVPGRLCIAGEHSDWAATYRSQNPSISPGAALVVGLQQGLHATATVSPSALVLFSHLAGSESIPVPHLLSHAHSSSLWRYAAGVAYIIHTRYTVTESISLQINHVTLPHAKGFSSSAAICVLVARAYNLLHKLNLTVAGEMDLAYAGERLTGSSCGRMDQVVAIGPGNAARMTFDGEQVSHIILSKSSAPVFVVVADLHASKHTPSILTALQKAFPRTEGEEASKLRDAFGSTTLQIIGKMQIALAEGRADKLGQLMTYAQHIFDDAAIPFCRDQLEAPVLHRILKDADVQPLVYGGKGVGSQGDGAVQFTAKDQESAVRLVKVLKLKLGTDAYIVNIGINNMQERKETLSIEQEKDFPNDKGVHMAVIPAAGFGTRLFPASRSIRPKALFPIVDGDGFAKPLILHLVEQCVAAGLEKIIIVVGSEEQIQAVKDVFSAVPVALYKALKPNMRKYADRIAQLERYVEIKVQSEPKGFGHAVACANINDGRPFLLLLGDVIFQSNEVGKSCVEQMLDAFEKNPEKSVIGVTQVPVSEAGAYGVVRTSTAISAGACTEIEDIIEKPASEEAKQLSHLDNCNIILGPYVFTGSLMRELDDIVRNDRRESGEIQLTGAMKSVLSKEGMYALLLKGTALDTGNAKEYVRTMTQLGHKQT